MTKKSILLLFVCAGAIQSNNFCMQTVRSFLPYRSDRPSMSIIERIEAAREELQQNPLALIDAASSNNLQKAQLLLTAGADISFRFSDETPLHIVARNGSEKIAELLLHHKDIDINVCKILGGLTPLHIAVCEGHKRVVQLLLEHQANVNVRNFDGMTPLHKAVFNDGLKSDEEVIKLLLEYNADITAQDRFGATPLHYAENLSILKALLSRQLELRSLKKLCLEQVKTLELSQGSLDILPSELKEALVLEPKPVSIRYALSIKDTEGKTVRDRAVEKGNQDTVDFIDNALKNAKA